MNRPKIVVLDGHVLNPGDNPWDEVAALGDLTVHGRTEPGDVAARAAGAHVLLTNKVRLGAETVRALPDLRFVSVLATGYDVVDTAAAADRAIPVSNVPGYGVTTVAQFVFALIMELNHRVSAHVDSVRRGEWSACPDWGYWLSPQVELAGQTLGVVGFGGIGSRVAALGHAFGMNVLAYAPRPKPDPGYRPFAFAPLEQLFEESDVVSLHCPLTSENKAFVNRELLARMKPEAILVNTARGALVDEPALEAALASGALRGAALDVVAQEPIRPDHPFLGLDNCLLTPHMAWASLAARQRLMRTTAANIRAWLDGAPVNVVNGV